MTIPLYDRALLDRETKTARVRLENALVAYFTVVGGDRIDAQDCLNLTEQAVFVVDEVWQKYPNKKGLP